MEMRECWMRMHNDEGYIVGLSNSPFLIVPHTIMAAHLAWGLDNIQTMENEDTPKGIWVLKVFSLAVKWGWITTRPYQSRNKD